MAAAVAAPLRRDDLSLLAAVRFAAERCLGI